MLLKLHMFLKQGVLAFATALATTGIFVAGASWQAAAAPVPTPKEEPKKEEPKKK